MQANLKEIQSQVTRLTFLDKVRLLEYLAPLIARSAPASNSVRADAGSSKRDNGSSFSVHPDREAMQKEIAAYLQLHPQLVSTFLGQYVAVYEGQVVDHDTDPAALHKRIKANFPNKVVLSRKVTTDPEPILHMRSPRLECPS